MQWPHSLQGYILGECSALWHVYLRSMPCLLLPIMAVAAACSLLQALGLFRV